ncbi:hypothetical protein PR048_021934 [Dryococelus australis]|uniref:Reverse transcriptase domain-containing protein n=1 Tax=Dryococelus australis TaxID=614101 RepID=A0ABQ9GZM2_9NEOP|nr:hypothetical protein PR048_021934 [Dryococelus australis]
MHPSTVVGCTADSMALDTHGELSAPDCVNASSSSYSPCCEGRLLWILAVGHNNQWQTRMWYSPTINCINSNETDTKLTKAVDHSLSPLWPPLQIDHEDNVEFHHVRLRGSVLGPLLFTIMVNDTGLVIRGKIRLFADDCVVYAAGGEGEQKFAGEH